MTFQEFWALVHSAIADLLGIETDDEEEDE
jgi:hypothetical protein